MMLRCTNPECRSCESFNIQATGDRWEYDGKGDLVKTRSGKRTKNLEEVKSYVAKCMKCGTKSIVKNLERAYNDPLSYFDTEMLCTCGGEICYEVEVQKSNSKVIDFSSGDTQRSVPVKTLCTKKCEKCGKIYK